jgi:hypothetical protein
MTIFVAIAAYRDPHLWRTVCDCVAKAADPQGLRFGIVEQSPQPTAPPLPADGLRYLHVHHRESRGVCWARSLAFGLYAGEDFLLQIDSHMLFAPGWDRTLINWLEAVSRPEPRAVISAYPFGFTETMEGGSSRLIVQAEPGHALVLRPRLDCDFTTEPPVLRFEGVPVPATQAILGCHVAAGCLFTRGSFVDAVPYDPRLYFHGEEQNLAIRAWTRGWNLFHIPDLPIFHLYRQPGPSNEVHWNTEDDAARAVRFSDLAAHSAQRLHDLLVGQRDLGCYGLGTTRSLADFAAFSGIDYPRLTLRRFSGSAALPSGPWTPPGFA